MTQVALSVKGGERASRLSLASLRSVHGGESADTLQDAGAATVAGLETSPGPIGRWLLLWSGCARSKHPQIHVPNRPAPISERVTENLRRGEAATGRNAVIRRGIIGQDRLPLVAPTPQDALDAPKLAVVP